MKYLHVFQNLNVKSFGFGDEGYDNVVLMDFKFTAFGYFQGVFYGRYVLFLEGESVRRIVKFDRLCLIL